ncbi:hypothetical protein [Paenibacillus physcomitrellae]|uniref:YneQ n=1 Tax=Paenibacillus physcomitrellae TaxID=1619311 RepID=A0ABQ1GD53_9BACL|nr:hypothetical protein [Paenibacillus physcomitrellae]GGA41352.1 hypothetical protein GCM10010917_28280 [Paenibacillus physcomitrellae]
MAFGIDRRQLAAWKKQVSDGEIAYLTHYWLDDRFPGARTVTKVGCSDLAKLEAWCVRHGLNPRYIHRRDAFPHFDLIGSKQRSILAEEGLWDQIHKFGLE